MSTEVERLHSIVRQYNDITPLSLQEVSKTFLDSHLPRLVLHYIGGETKLVYLHKEDPKLVTLIQVVPSQEEKLSYNKRNRTVLLVPDNYYQKPDKKDKITLYKKQYLNSWFLTRWSLT